MIFGSSREEFRQFFFTAFRKYQNNQALEPLESQVVQIILEHPEYHFIFESDENQFHDEWENQRTENPFLHMSLHLSIRDQAATDKPQGFTAIYQALVQQLKNPLEAEHKMMRVVSLTIQKMLQENKVFDEKEYLSELKKLL